ncbi:YdcF family protein [Ramlibacter sp. RBP-2]|uniref:YdcF family protein n=1 Tax=Ramlibacter lithotrophicus TaxID=2606681 RepID=A0A7X6DID8_9BURK|nr:YdcF family protein [Ramlibacter lithotrophicus]NKE67695.1 YdcF family protein [Ramlibacter lithotrophicus]
MLSKLVIAAISPLGTALLLGLAGLALATGASAVRRRAGLLLIAGALGWLAIWSLPVASDGLRGWLEEAAGSRAVEALPPAQALVVLGGSIRGARLPRRPYPDLGASADRLWHAARLHRAAKAPLLVLSGGTVHEGEAPEAQVMRLFLVELGVPPAAMVLEPASVTTAENAAFSARLLRQRGIRQVLLVTSALHMRRARALFEREGIGVIPAPTDHEIVDRPFRLLDMVPDAEALEGSGRAIKEIVGAWAGR